LLTLGLNLAFPNRFKEETMLVLTRRVGESMVIDDQIVVQVIGIKGNTVRLGITAPTAVQVDREEVHQRRQEFAAKVEFSCD
jgi:carbon storage regulator